MHKTYANKQTRVPSLDIFFTSQDFDELVTELHKRKMKIVLDFIPSHSSDLHLWFRESQKGGADNQYAEYYIWQDGKESSDGERLPPDGMVR